MCGVFTHTDCNGNGNAYCYPSAKVYSFTAAAPHAAASTIRSGFNGIVFLRGLAMFVSPRNAYITGRTLGALRAHLSIAQIAHLSARAVIDCGQRIAYLLHRIDDSKLWHRLSAKQRTRKHSESDVTMRITHHDSPSANGIGSWNPPCAKTLVSTRIRALLICYSVLSTNLSSVDRDMLPRPL